jgi:hypothetical protein
MDTKIKKTTITGLAYATMKWLLILIVGGAIYKSRYWSNWFFLIFPILVISFLSRRKRKSNAA